MHHYNFSSLELRSLNLMHHDNVPVHKESFMKTSFAKAEVEQLECPAQP